MPIAVQGQSRYRVPQIEALAQSHEQIHLRLQKILAPLPKSHSEHSRCIAESIRIAHANMIPDPRYRQRLEATPAGQYTHRGSMLDLRVPLLRSTETDTDFV